MTICVALQAPNVTMTTMGGPMGQQGQGQPQPAPPYGRAGGGGAQGPPPPHTAQQQSQQFQQVCVTSFFVVRICISCLFALFQQEAICRQNWSVCSVPMVFSILRTTVDTCKLY
jgi:hypothetical protein